MESIDQLKILESDPIVVNLENEAFIDAGAARGDALVLKSKLGLIFSGALLDQSTFITLTNVEIAAIHQQISTLELNANNIKGDVDILQENIKNNKSKIDDYKSKLEEIQTGHFSKGKIGASVELFNLPKFIIASFFLVMLSIFIFLFYVAVVYKAIIMNESEIASQFSTDSFGVNVLPHGKEVWHAIRTNVMVIFAPFVFFAFGYALHSLQEQVSKLKYLWMGLVIAITFVLDYFLAERIHDKMNSALSIMGQDPNSKFSDILIVLILGFVVYIIWSLIFHSWITELEKRNVPSSISKLIHKLERQNKEHFNAINNSKKSISSLSMEISQNKSKLDNKYVSMSSIIKSISLYTNGWYRFIAMLADPLKSQLKHDCESTVSAFKTNHGLGKYKIESENI